MSNKNEQFFREKYPDQWQRHKSAREHNLTHFRYQQISLEHLECFDGCDVLELGCASGELLARIGELWPTANLYGCDLGIHDVAWLTEKLPNQPRFLQGDTLRIPIASNSFDRVLCSSVLWYVPDPLAAIREMIRVLKPGGRFVFDVRNPIHITNALAKVTLTKNRMQGRAVPAYRYLTPGELEHFLADLPVKFEINGYFVLLPTRLPILGEKWGGWAAHSDWLAFHAGHGVGKWLASKLLVNGTKSSP